MTSSPPSRELFPFWSSERILISGLAANTFLQPTTRSMMAEFTRAVLDDDVALAAELVDDELTCDFASLHVVRRDSQIGAVSCGIDGNDDDAGVTSLLRWRARESLGVARIEEDHVDAGCNEIVDLVDLLVEILFKAEGRDFDIGIDLLRFAFCALCKEPRRRISGGKRDADSIQVLGEPWKP